MKKNAVRILLVALVLTLGVKVAVSHAPTTKPDTSKHAATTQAKASEKESVDINSATKEQLDAPPRIGEKYAQKTIDGHPYVKKTDLVNGKIIVRPPITSSRT